MCSWIERPPYWCVIALFLALSPKARGGFTVIDLGPLASSQSGGATGINGSGATSGFTVGSSGGYQAVFSSGTSGFQTVDISRLQGATTSVATGINVTGDVSGTFYNATDQTYHAFKTVSGRAVDLGTLSGVFKGADTFGAGISGSGEVVGTARLSGGSQVVFRSTVPGQISTVVLPGNSTVGQASGVNESGMIVGSYLNAQGVSRVFTAVGNQGIEFLAQYPALGFGLNTYGTAINNLGSVAGSGDFGGQSHAFVASTNPITGVKLLIDIGVTGGYGSSHSFGLNDKNQVVGSLDNQGVGSHAFLWDQSIGLLDLNSLLSPSDQKAWTLTNATGINDSGQIVGQGLLNGQLHGYLLNPVSGTFPFLSPGSVPAPPSLWMALGALSMVGFWLRFRPERIADLDAV